MRESGCHTFNAAALVLDKSGGGLGREAEEEEGGETEKDHPSRDTGFFRQGFAA